MQKQEKTDTNIVIVGLKTQQLKQKVKDAWNPSTCLLTISFKLLAISIYLMLKLMTDIYFITFTIVLIMVCMDFWIVKNISGRILVGLKWWSQWNQNDNEEWIYQSNQLNRNINIINSIIFWIPFIAGILFWISIALINIVTLNLFWFVLACFNSGLGLINFISYMKCKGSHQQYLKMIAKKFKIDIFEH